MEILPMISTGPPRVDRKGGGPEASHQIPGFPENNVDRVLVGNVWRCSGLEHPVQLPSSYHSCSKSTSQSGSRHPRSCSGPQPIFQVGQKGQVHNSESFRLPQRNDLLLKGGGDVVGVSQNLWDRRGSSSSCRRGRCFSTHRSGLIQAPGSDGKLQPS